MSPSVIIHRAQDIESALVLTNFLQFHGFDASIDNAAHASVDWSIIPALGGITVRLPRAQVDEAKSLLRRALRDARGNPEMAEPSHLRPDWKKRFLAWSMLGFYTGVLPVAVAILIAWLASLLPADLLPGLLSTPVQDPLLTYSYNSGAAYEAQAHSKDDPLMVVWILVGLGAFLLGLERVTRPTPDELMSEPQ